MALAISLTGLSSVAAQADDLRLGVMAGGLDSTSRSALIDALATAWLNPWKSKSAQDVTLVQGSRLPDADVVLGPAQAISEACNSGELIPTTIRTKMRTGSLLRRASAGCGVAVLSQQISLGFRRDAFEDAAPSDIDALFDTKTFPGKRALVAGPNAIIEWALMSYGVPHQDLYELLSSERGLKLVFRRLDRIRDSIIWCRTTTCSRRALESGEAVMAMLDHGASVALRGEATTGFVAAASIADHLELAVSDGSRTDDASDFADFVESEDRLEALSTAAKLAGPVRDADALVRDSAWYARTMDRLVERFSAWLGTQHVRPD